MFALEDLKSEAIQGLIASSKRVPRKTCMHASCWHPQTDAEYFTYGSRGGRRVKLRICSSHQILTALNACCVTSECPICDDRGVHRALVSMTPPPRGQTASPSETPATAPALAERAEAGPSSFSGQAPTDGASKTRSRALRTLPPHSLKRQATAAQATTSCGSPPMRCWNWRG